MPHLKCPNKGLEGNEEGEGELTRSRLAEGILAGHDGFVLFRDFFVISHLLWCVYTHARTHRGLHTLTCTNVQKGVFYMALPQHCRLSPLKALTGFARCRALGNASMSS